MIQYQRRNIIWTHESYSFTHYFSRAPSVWERLSSTSFKLDSGPGQIGIMLNNIVHEVLDHVGKVSMYEADGLTLD